MTEEKNIVHSNLRTAQNRMHDFISFKIDELKKNGELNKIFSDSNETKLLFENTEE